VYHYQVKLIKVVDGDTVDVDIDLGFNVWLRSQRIRLHGIDTPESRTRDKEEKRFGMRSKQFLSHAVGTKVEHGPLVGSDTHKKLTLQSHGVGKFGRVLGVIFADGINVNELLVETHHAVAYHGQSKDEIREAHLANREKLMEI
jgi:micrococcal nuclease